MEEDVFSAAIGAQEAKSLFFEIGHHGARLGLSGYVFRRLAGRCLTALGTTALVANALLQERHILIGKFAGGMAPFRGHLQIRIFLERFFKEAFLSGVQTSSPCSQACAGAATAAFGFRARDARFSAGG